MHRDKDTQQMEKPEKVMLDLRRLHVINEHESRSWSWLARQSHRLQIKIWLSVAVGLPSLRFLSCATLNTDGYIISQTETCVPKKKEA